MHLLSSALRGDFGLQFIDEDRDLDPLRSLPEFKGIVAAARALQTGSGTATSKGG